MKAIVLVGGRGTRLRPLTLDTPKPLLPIANKPFLERQLDWLAEFGIDHVVLSMGYLPDAFEAHFDGSTYRGMQISYAVEEEPLGTAGGVAYAAAGSEERFVVCNGDVLTDLDLAEMVSFHDKNQAEATICLSEVEDPSAFGVVPTREDGSVIAFVEKPPADRAPSRWINAGTYVLEPSFLERIPPRLNVSIERETFPKVIEEPDRLFGFQSTGYWLDIGTPDKYLQAHYDLLSRQLGAPLGEGLSEVAPRVWSSGPLDSQVVSACQGPVLLGENLTFEAGAQIENSTLASGCSVAGGACVRNSVLGAGSKIGPQAVVEDSIVGPGAQVGSGCRVRQQSIIGPGQTLPAGVNLAAGRMPESD